jgi:hypothetical protein
MTKNFLKQTHRALPLLALLLITVASPLKLKAQSYEYYDGIYYQSLEDGTLELANARDCSGDIVIPNGIDGKPVTSIGYEAFYSCHLTSVIIGNNVTNIGEYAFANSSLTSVTFGENVKNIGSYAFENCNRLSSVTFGNSVSTIGFSAFSGCTGLTTLSLPNSVTEISSGAFSGCTGLTTLGIPDSVTEIGGSAFSGCSDLYSIDFGSSIKEIGNYAFSYCRSLHSIILPNSVTSIGDYAFYGCENMVSVVIGNKVKTIGERAFYNCKLLKGAYPNTATVSNSGLDGYATSYPGNNSLVEDGIVWSSDKTKLYFVPIEYQGDFTIPNTVTEIGRSAFSYCTGVTAVFIPESVSFINFPSFDHCPSLQKFVVDSNNEDYASDELGALYFKSLRVLNACPGSLTEFEIPDCVKTINGYAFMGNTNLVSVTIPNSVSNIYSSAFSGCSSLKELDIPSSISEISSFAFYKCSGISQLRFEDGDLELEIGSSAFSSVAPTEVYYGRQMDFSAVSCSNLESVEFGENVTSIANKAFSSATSLRSVTAHSTVPPTIGDATFANDTYNEGKLYVENDAINAYTTADGWKNFVDVKALDGTSTGVSEISNNSTDLFSVANGAICVDGDTDVRIVSISGTTVYNGRGKAIVNVTPGVYIVIMGNTHAKVAVK